MKPKTVKMMGTSGPQKEDPDLTNKPEPKMPRKKKTDVAARFQDWLLYTKDYLPTTAAVYGSSLRYLMEQLGEDITEEQLHLLFVFIRANAPTRLGNCRRAWSLFVEFAKSHGLSLPDAPEQRSAVRSANESIKPLPQHVLVAASSLLAKYEISERAFKRLRWMHVGELRKVEGNELFKGEFYTLHKPSGEGSWLVERQVIDVLRAYAQPNTDGTTALVPTEPGSVYAYPVNRIT